MADTWNQLDPHNAKMLALTTKLHSTDAAFVLLTNVVAINNINSNNKDTGGPAGSRRDNSKD